MRKVYKVLRLSGGDWYLVFKDGEEKKLSVKELRNIANQAVKYVRAAFIKTVGSLVELTEEGKFRLTRKSYLSHLIYKGLPKEVKFETENISIQFPKKSFITSMRYFIEKDIKNNLLQGKLIALKTIPIVKQAKDGAIKNIEFRNTANPERTRVVIELTLFKNAILRWVQDFKTKKCEENSYLKLLERIRDGEYDLAYVGFGYKERGNKKGPYLIFCYKITVPQRERRGGIMGVDLGQRCLAYFAISGSHARGDLTKDSEFAPQWLRSEQFDWRKKIYAVWTKRKRLVRELNQINNLLRNEGGDESLKRRKRQVVKELESIRNYESNFMETLNKTVASIVKKVAEKEGVDTVVMPEIHMDPEKKNSLMFPKWNYSQLQTYIENKLKEIDVKVVKVNPACTSLRCPECGYIGFLKDLVRQGKDKFACPFCGYKANADYVAARNLATEGIEEIINRYLKVQIEALGGDHKDIPPEKNHILSGLRRRLISKKLNGYLGLPENTSLKKALAKLKRREYNFYREFIRDPVKFLNGSLSIEYLKR